MRPVSLIRAAFLALVVLPSCEPGASGGPPLSPVARLEAGARATAAALDRLACGLRSEPLLARPLVESPTERYAGLGDPDWSTELFHSPADGWRAEHAAALRAKIDAQLAAARRPPRSVVFYPSASADAAHSARVPWTGSDLLPVAPRWMPPAARRLFEAQRSYPSLIQGCLLLALAPYNLNATKAAHPFSNLRHLRFQSKPFGVAHAPANASEGRATIAVGTACVRSSWLIERALLGPVSGAVGGSLRALPRTLGAAARRLIGSARASDGLDGGGGGDGGQRASELFCTRTLSAPRVCCTASWRPRGPIASERARDAATALRAGLGLGGGGAREAARRVAGGPRGGPARDGLVAVAFRGTKQVGDVLTDIDALPARFPAFLPRGVRAHRGFGRAYDSIREQLDDVLREALPEGGRVVLTGHSLGGALAQLAAVSIAASSAAEGRPIRPLLVTFASPAVGDGGFARELRAAAEPCGGLRVYNSADPIPHIAAALGYRHAGIPLILTLRADAVAAYRRVVAPQPGFGAVASHVLYHVGATVYAIWTPVAPTGSLPPEGHATRGWRARGVGMAGAGAGAAARLGAAAAARVPARLRSASRWPGRVDRPLARTSGAPQLPPAGSGARAGASDRR